jgi:hypothetical protein
MIALIMEAASISETSVNFYQAALAQQPEDSHLHTPHQNLKSHYITIILWMHIPYSCSVLTTFNLTN